MHLLRFHLSRVRIPEPTAHVYKQDCCVSFHTPRSEGGLFVDLFSFLAFGRDFVEWNYRKSGNPVYLHIKQTKKPIPEDRPAKKPTLLAIGVDGGFDNNEPEYEETFSIVILPDYVTLPFPSVELPEKVRLAVDAVLLSEGTEKKEQLSAWAADKKHISAFAVSLEQVGNGVFIPPSGWKCARCDKVDNLWLNLTDGTILCGRKNWDGSGGNNHAVEYYNETKYPLAVKLGTITADLESADVYSYPEDESVEDPLLAQHLAFFGIDFSLLKKTEMTTAEKELDQNTNFDWNRIQESGQEVVPLSGPGYTGIINIGNSCYLASIMQVMFSTNPFCSRYYTGQDLKETFDNAPADPTVDLNMQLTKFGHGLLSGRYSALTTEKQEGISPRMFKTVIAAVHPEFNSMRQQDACEFFLHFLDNVQKIHTGKHELDPTKGFRFGVEDRILCPSGKVAYNKRTDCMLSLSIPLDAAINKEEIEAYDKLKNERALEGKKIDDEIVRPRIRLETCLERFASPEEVEGFYSTALKSKTTAIKSTGLTTFPDFLMIHLRKFGLAAGWVPIKMDVYVDVPDVIDISHMRSIGLQPGEELLPEAAPADSSGPAEPFVDEVIVSQLASMGFNYLHCQKAAINTSNTGIEEAMNWLLTHMDDPDINDPIVQEADTSEYMVDEGSLSTLISFGFQENVARKALKAVGGDIERATDWIFSHPDESSEPDATAASSSVPSTTQENLPDGGGKYKLKAIVSHIGTSTQCGHYVAHVHKDGRWVIFNDNKVGASVDPPKDMGYMYLFERIVQ